MKMKPVVALAMAGLMLTACDGQQNAYNANRGGITGGGGFSKSDVGTGLGAVGGAVIGSSFGKGNGRVVGGVIGGLLGARLVYRRGERQRQRGREQGGSVQEATHGS